MKAMTVGLLAVSLLLVLTSSVAAEVSPEAVVEAIGYDRGICVVLGDTQCAFALKLVGRSDLTIYVQEPGAEAWEAACRTADEAGYYGTRLFVGKGPLTELHPADNIVDAVVVLSSEVDTPERELLRVLRPGGTVLFKDRTLVKPLPAGVDDWSHPYHGPDNNPQSDDRVIVAPYLTQFLAEPRYAPLPQVAVASAGRVFKAFGHVAFKVREEPLLNKLVAFNGYNGTMLWQRDLHEGVMIHRNTMIATPAVLYVGDDQSCKVIDAATGQLKDEIVPPVEKAGGTFWKWMALEDGVLYAMTGQGEQRDPTKKWRRDAHGWPWDPVSEGFNQADHPWGFGRNVLAIDPKTKKVLWSHHEDEPIDGRAICMKGGRLFFFRFGSYLACLDAATGTQLWRKTPKNDPALFQSLGEYLERRQDWRTNWRTACYLKCSEDALYFAGPPVGKLLALSAKDGSILWENAYNNFQLVLRDDGLYAISGQIDNHPSQRFDPLTGKVLGEIGMHRRACTRPNGSADAIFFRAEGGSVRLDMTSQQPEWISPMRPNCHDGVTIANGLLYWWPSVCDCQLTLYGITCLGPAGPFDFTPVATEAERLEKGNAGRAVALSISDRDWSTFRADNACSATTPVAVASRVQRLWQLDAEVPSAPAAQVVTAPVTAGGLAFVGGCDGSVRAVDVATGKQRWKAYTGGAIRVAPTVWQGRVFVGSGDGWAYAFAADTGRLCWRFRAAPAERLIPMYGALTSTWPAASGVLVEDGVAYVAAGIANYDGTYLYALDAESGAIKWQNNVSGHLDTKAHTGVSVQGHMLLHDGKLYLAGGTSVSPAVYDTRTGRCLNDGAQLAECVSRSPRGWELSLLTDYVVACGKPFYAHPEHDVYDATVFDRVFLSANGTRQVVWASSQNEQHILCFRELDRAALARKLADPGERFHVSWARLAPKAKPGWAFKCRAALATAVCENGVVVATESQLLLLDLGDGHRVWTQALPAAPVPWGVAVDRMGRVIVTLEDGRVLCFGPDEQV